MSRPRTLAGIGGTETYDTVTALLREAPREARDAHLWRRTLQRVDNETGEVSSRSVLNVPGGPSLTLVAGGLLVERSLPKALWGQNVSDLPQDAVAVALAVVDGEVSEALPGVTLPPLASWEPVRADYCESRRLGSEAEVLRSLDRLAHITLPRKGLPVRGENHGVRWPHGRVQPKFYSKFLETRGDPNARGVLRREASVYRLDTFRKLLSLAQPTIRDVLTPDAHRAAWAPFADHLRGAGMTKEEMGDLALIRELVGFFGARRAASLIGYCVLFVVAGAETRQDMLASDVLEFRTKYRVLADIRAFRSAMSAKGYRMTGGEPRAVRGPEADAEDAALVRHLAAIRAA